MPIYTLGTHAPRIDPQSWIAPNATVIGEVEIAKGASIWWSCTLRGDTDLLSVGENSNIQDNSVLHTDPGLLLSVLRNLIDNALKYGKHAHLVIEDHAHAFVLHVDDDGPGVSPEDREHIFRPFYRTDEARDRESGGTGLGLAIVDTAIQQHRGWVKADDSPLGGLRLIIWLPLYNRATA